MTAAYPVIGGRLSDPSLNGVAHRAIEAEGVV